MNAYDFDNTIYDGESTYDFFMLSLKKYPQLFKFFPGMTLKLLLYKLNMLKIKSIEKSFNKILEDFISKRKINLEDLVKEFWDNNYKKIKKDFVKKIKKEDLIITGCPNFLINYIKKDLITNNIICTEFNEKTLKLEFICFGNNKVLAYNKKYKGKKIENFYTDSKADAPLMKYAKNVYFVKGNKVKKIR